MPQAGEAMCFRPVPRSHPAFAPRWRYHLDRARSRRSMTCAIGLVTSAGILLCADEQYAGITVAHEPKIFGIPLKNGYVHVAVAGCEATSRAAVEACEEALHRLPWKPRTVGQVRDIVQGAVQRVYARQVADIINAFEREQAEFEMLIAIGGMGVSTKRVETRLYAVSTPHATMQRVTEFKCVGTGGVYFAEHVVRAGYEPRLSNSDAVILALHAIAVAKKRDPNTGGQTHFARMFADGMVTAVIPHSSAVSERCSLEYEQHARALLLRLGDTDSTDDAFLASLARFQSDVFSLREQWKTAAHPYRELIDNLNRRQAPAVNRPA